MDSAAVGTISKAFHLYDTSGLVQSAVAVAALPVWREWARQGEQLPMCERALELAEPGSVGYGSILVKQAMCAAGSLALEERERAFAAALAIAKQHDAKGLEIRARSVLVDLALLRLDMRCAAEHAAAIRELAAQECDPEAQCEALRAVCQYGYRAPLPVRELRGDVDALLAAAERLRDRRRLATAHEYAERLALAAADWSRARKHSELYLAYEPQGERIPVMLCHRSIIELESGDEDAANRAFARAVDITRGPREAWARANTAHWACQLMLRTAGRAWLDVAECLVAEGLPAGFAVPNSRYHLEYALAALAVMRGDGRAAEAYFRSARREEGTNPDVPLSFLPGLCARAAGLVGEAVEALRRSMSRCEELGYLWALHWNLFFLAETLLQRSEPGDREEARAALERLMKLAEEAGSVLVLGRARKLLDGMGTQAEPAASRKRPDGLTEREIEILRHIATGETNKEIGFALSISPRTVNAHVQNILDKINVANRAEAAVYAVRNGLTSA